MDDVSLAINGTKYSGWKSVSITKSIKSLCGSFQLEVTDVWGEEKKPWRIRQGDSCEVFIDTEKVKTGYVDAVEPSYSATTRRISTRGRDKTLDLVDCSTDLKEVEFRNLRPHKIIEKIVKPFGIEVVNSAPISESIDLWTLQKSESPYENIEKVCKKRGLLVLTDALGRLQILGTERQRTTTALIEGKNILSASASFDISKRFSEYKVQTQAQGSAFSEDEELDSEEYITSIEAKSRDALVKRYRPLIVIMPTQGSAADAKRRAQWEATVRAAQSSAATVEVQGWRQGDGRLWEVNTIVPVHSPWLEIESEMLITGLNFTKGPQGTRTTLELEPPNAYTPEPVIDDGIGLWKELS